jgi:hypothetical protein
LPQDDTLLPLITTLTKNNPPKILDDQVTRPIQFPPPFKVAFGGDCLDVVFEVPVSDPDLEPDEDAESKKGTRIRSRWMVIDPDKPGPNNNLTEGEPVIIPRDARAQPVTIRQSFSRRDLPLSQPGDYIIQVVVSDGELNKLEPIHETMTVEGVTVTIERFTDTFMWFVKTEDLDTGMSECPPP